MLLGQATERSGVACPSSGRRQTVGPVADTDRGIGRVDIEYAGNGLVYAISHPWPKEVLHSELLLLDLPGKRIVARTRLDTVAVWPLEVSFQRDDRYLYGATRQGIYRVPLGTVHIEMIWCDEKDGPTAGGALLNGSYYFATIERLRSVAIGG
ncbi:MAG: hypothetical protein K8S99_11100 [Planctomycetes bacterium]|nr:hypothetical protein [Planctomycetota bacterium]